MDTLPINQDFETEQQAPEQAHVEQLIFRERTESTAETITAPDIVNAMGEVAITAAFDQMMAEAFDPSPTDTEQEAESTGTTQEAQRVASADVQESEAAMRALLKMLNYRAIEEKNGTPLPLLDPLPSQFSGYSLN